MLNDIIKKYHQTFHILESSHSPKIQLFAIINFFRFCEEENQSHLFSKFITDFLGYIINIFKHGTIDFFDPAYLNASKHILRKALNIEKSEIVINEICEIIELLNIKLLLLYYYLGEIENGKIILQDLLNSKYVVNSGVSLDIHENKNDKFSGNRYSVVDPALFKVNKVFDILRKINYEINRLNTFSGNDINILLVESDNLIYGIKNFGLVQSLECNITKKKNINIKNPYFENTIDVQEKGIDEIRHALINTSKSIASLFGSNISFNKYQINLKYRELAGIYKGTSFGAGASLLLTSKYLNEISNRQIYLISYSAAFTGSIDELGNLQKLPDSSIRTKIEAAFYSWIKYVVVPEENIIEAKQKLNDLNRKYSRKKLNIIGAKNITDILSNSNIIKIEKENTYQHTRKIIKKHPVPALIIFSFILILLTSFLINMIIPVNIKPYPQAVSGMYVIYAPDRDTVWKFDNSDMTGGDTIPFGEVGIGDQWLHKINLWNNGDKKEPIRVEIEGKDKDEFEIVWDYSPYQFEAPAYILPDLKQLVMIKFIPYKTEGNKEAKVTIYSENEPEIKKILYLKGKAGIYKNGYSLKLQKDDEFIINPKGNVLKDEFTISFWFKTNKIIEENEYLFSSENTNWTQTKFTIFILPDSTIKFDILRSKMNNGEQYILKSNDKIKLYEWNYIAITHLNNKTTLFVNNEILNLETEENHFLQIEDMFYFGTIKHPIKRGTYDIRKDDRYLQISEFRIYNKSLSNKEILSKKYIKEYPFDNRLILYYDFIEMMENKVFDKTINDVYADLYGLPERSLDTPPLLLEEKKSISERDKDSYVKVWDKGEILLNKNLFNAPSSFTIQYDAKAGGDLKAKRHFNYICGIESSINWGYLYGDSIEISYSNLLNNIRIQIPAIRKILDSNWHKYIFDYNIDNNKSRLFIDGIKMLEIDLGKNKYDISRELYFITFGNQGVYYNPRFIGEESSIDNIAIFNRTLKDNEIKLSKPEDIKSIPGLLAQWTFNTIDGHLCYDEVNHIPVFLWEDYKVLNR